MADLRVCEVGGHEKIQFECEVCPLCAAEAAVRELEDEKLALTESVKDLKEEVRELKKEYGVEEDEEEEEEDDEEADGEAEHVGKPN